MSEKNNDSSSIIMESCYIIDTSTINPKNSNIIKSKSLLSNNQNDNDLSKINYEITSYNKIIGKHVKQANCIKELKNFYLISSGTDNKIILYDLLYRKIEEKKIENWIFNVDEIDLSRNYADKDTSFQIVCNINNKILYLINNKNDYLICKHIFQADSFLSFNYLDDGIICTKKGIKLERNLFCPFHIKEYKETHRKLEEERYRQREMEMQMKIEMQMQSYNHFKHRNMHNMPNMQNMHNMPNKFYKMHKKPYFPFTHYDHLEEYKNRDISTKTYKSGIRINNNICAFTSNSVDINGEDKLIIYNVTKNKIIYEAKNYSFTISPNNLCLISIEKNKEKAEKESNLNLLFVACKKYKKNQKNGILLIKIDRKNEAFSNIFYNTKNFEVFCFCHILNVIQTGYIFKNDVEIHDTDYILIGGFDKAKGKGIMKLFKLLIDENNFLNTKLEYIQDIEMKYKNNESFKGPISSICQSKKKGNLLISCWDGNIYLFTPPNIEYFEFYDKQI